MITSIRYTDEANQNILVIYDDATTIVVDQHCKDDEIKEWLKVNQIQPYQDTTDYMKFLRLVRNSKLENSDWTQLEDSPVDKKVWATYRQALRDFPARVNVTTKEEFDAIIWPQEP